MSYKSRMKTILSGSAAAFLALVISGCAAERPVLYPNEKLTTSGPAISQQDIDNCMALAESSGARAHGSTPDPGEVAVNTGAGAASGAARGAVHGNPGTGAAAGAAGAAAGSVFRGFFRPHKNPMNRRFVEMCLHERGYQVVGWQ